MAQLLLDRIPGAAAAYSLRKLSDSYAGAAVRVRRSSDNTEQDIGFVGVDLDQGALLAFVGAGSGYVTKWYDQSGNNRDAVQATQASQPRLVNAGVVDTDTTNKPTIYFDGTNDFLTFSSVTLSGDWSVHEVKSRTSSGVVDPFIRNQSVDAMYPAIWWSNTTVYLSNSNFYRSLSDVSTSLRLVSSYNISNTLSAYKNSTLLSFGSNNNAPVSNVWDCLCKTYNSVYSNGKYSEVIIYPSDQSTNRVLIEDNINGYYNIFIPVTAQPNTLFTSAAAAYSLRKLYSDYPGPAVRVRRSSDNAEADIYFVNDQLDQGALMNHVGYSNLLQYSQQLDNAWWFKQGISVSANTTAAPDGTLTADTYTTNGGGSIERYTQAGSTTSSTGTFTLSIYVKKGTCDYFSLEMYAGLNIWSTATFDLSLSTPAKTKHANGASGNIQYVSSSVSSYPDGWWRLSLTCTSINVVRAIFQTNSSATPTYNAYGIEINSLNGPYLYVWGAQLNEGSSVTAYLATTSTTYDGNGFVTTWYDQSYGSQQNLFTYSEQFDNAAWPFYQSSISANSAIAPNGTLTADSIVEDGATNAHRVSQGPLSVTSGVVYTFSVYIKKVNVDYLQLAASQPTAFPNGSGAYFNIANGTVAALGTSSTATIEDVGGGWYRCSVSVTAVATTTAIFYINPTTSSSTSVYTGINGRTSVYIWGAQLTTGSYLRRYVATTSSTINALRDASQGTAANQPRIVNGGSVEKYDVTSGKPTIYFNAKRLISSFSLLSQPLTFFTTLRLDALSGLTASVIYDSYNNTRSVAYFSGTTETPNNRWVMNSSNSALPYATNPETSLKILLTTLHNSSSSYLYSNNVQFLSLDAGSNGLDGISIGDIRGNPSPVANNYFLQGRICEMIIFSSDKSSDRLSIQSNINGYYTIY